VLRRHIAKAAAASPPEADKPAWEQTSFTFAKVTARSSLPERFAHGNGQVGGDVGFGKNAGNARLGGFFYEGG